MNIEFKECSKNEFNFIITGEETILNPIKKKLILDETVSFAGFMRDHPLIEGVNFSVKGKNVEVSIKKAIKDFETDLKELGKLIA